MMFEDREDARTCAESLEGFSRRFGGDVEFTATKTSTVSTARLLNSSI
jgi:hypothetical protein